MTHNTTSNPKLTVVGSINLDLLVRTTRLPQPGETVLGNGFTQAGGGKGANQAIAAARLGLPVRLVAAVGDDAYGHRLIDDLANEGVDVSCVRRLRGPQTGTALIVVDETGENTIVVSPGANLQLSLDDNELADLDAVLCQLEVPVEVVAQAAQHCRGLFSLNASPMMDLPSELVDRCDLIIVNESEYKSAGGQLDSCRLVALTLGASGAVLLGHGREIARAESPRVKAIDTVGAGDAFAAAMVAGLITHGDPVAALELACRAGALAVTRNGAQASLPFKEEL
jgi:ribokinase